MSDQFWLKDPYVLFRQDRLVEFFTSNDQTTNEKLNSITRFGIYVSIILAMYQKNPKYLLLCLLTFLLTYLIYMNLDKNQENFEEEDTEDPYKGFTKPTINNPFGNSSIVDIIDNPKRPPMVDYSSNLKVQEDIDKAFNYNLYRDLDDVYGKQNSQRQYYTTPSRGTIPADSEGEFKNWLYGGMKSCKDNTYECDNFESPRRLRQVYFNPLEDPVNTEAKKNM